MSDLFKMICPSCEHVFVLTKLAASKDLKTDEIFVTFYCPECGFEKEY